MELIYGAILVWMGGLYWKNQVESLPPRGPKPRPEPMYMIDPETGKEMINPGWVSDLYRRMDGYTPVSGSGKIIALPRNPSAKKPRSSGIITY